MFLTNLNLNLEEEQIEVTPLSDIERAELDNDIQTQTTELDQIAAEAEDHVDCMIELGSIVDKEEVTTDPEERQELLIVANETYLYSLAKLGYSRDEYNKYKLYTEGFGDILKGAASKIKDFVIYIYEKIKALFKWIWSKGKALVKKIGVKLGLVKEELKETVKEAKKSDVKKPDITPEVEKVIETVVENNIEEVSIPMEVFETEYNKIVGDAPIEDVSEVETSETEDTGPKITDKQRKAMASSISKFIAAYGHLMSTNVDRSLADNMKTLINRPLDLDVLKKFSGAMYDNYHDIEDMSSPCDNNFYDHHMIPFEMYKSPKEFHKNKVFQMLLGLELQRDESNNLSATCLASAREESSSGYLILTKVGVKRDRSIIRQAVKNAGASKETLLEIAEELIKVTDKIGSKLEANIKKYEPEVDKFMKHYKEVMKDPKAYNTMEKQMHDRARNDEEYAKSDEYQDSYINKYGDRGDTTIDIMVSRLKNQYTFYQIISKTWYTDYMAEITRLSAYLNDIIRVVYVK